MFSFVGNMKTSVSESGQNDVKDGEEGRNQPVENRNFIKHILLAGSLEDSCGKEFVISLFQVLKMVAGKSAALCLW